ncbi:MAG TPA: hypothetical protein VFP05_04430, partial [Thermomicrobiales bacterium]|nr:hypothetical protein [Thermomicrobiales bacterium]
QALAGGDTDTLAALLSPSFVDHDAGSGASQSLAEFLDRVSLLGQTSTVAPMVVDEIEVSGSNLIVHLGRTAMELRLFDSFSIEGTWDQPAFEVLRVARGQVIDRWSSGIHRLEATAFDEIVLYAPPLANLGTWLVRVDIPAGVVHQWHAAGSGFLLIESGSARMQVIHLDESEETFELDQGSGVLVKVGDRVQFRSVDDGPVMALVYALKRRVATEGPEAILPVSALHAHSEGVTQSMLWSGVLPQTEAGTVHRVGSMVLLAGEEVRLTAPASATLLVAIDSGTLDISAPQSTIEILGDDFWPADHADMARIDVDGAAWVTPKGELTLRNTAKDPTRVLLVTVDTAPRRGGGRLQG